MLKHISLAAALLCAQGQLFAASTATDPSSETGADAHPGTVPARGKLEEVSVYSSRIIDDTAATVTVITRQDLQEKGARTIKDALRDEVDVVVRTRPGQFSTTRSSIGRARNEAINIRGIEGNRVLIVQDGIRLPNGFSFGPAFQTGRGDYWDVESMQKIEILRGANSTQYGADSIAGVVSATTIGVDDILKPGAAIGGVVQSGYGQQDNSFNHSAAVGFKGERWDGMLLASRRDGHETASQEGDRRPNVLRTAPDPANIASRYYLGKLGLRLGARDRLRVTAESLHLQVDTLLLSQVSSLPTFRATRDLRANDTTQRRRLSLEYVHEGGEQDWLARLHAHLYWQQAGVRQITGETVFGPDPDDWWQNYLFQYYGSFYGARSPGLLSRTRDNRYGERMLGLNVVADSRFNTSYSAHSLRYGFDISRTLTGATVDGTVPMMGHAYPHKSGPDSSYLLAGAFIQNEIAWAGLKITPGLRYDYYRITPDVSSLSDYDLQRLPRERASLQSQSGHAFTPRLGVIWEIAPAFSPYFNVAKGFRAPTPDQTNGSFYNPALKYVYIGNPSLRPERVSSKEIGIRGRLEGFSYSVAAFDSKYTDFINQRGVGLRPDMNAVLHSNVNDNAAHIRGAEARTEWDINARWRLNAAIAYTRGDVTRPVASPQWGPGYTTVIIGHRSEPLNSVQPMRAVLGAVFRQASWGGHAGIEHSWGKSRDRIATPANTVGEPLMTRAYTVVNAGAWVKPTSAATVTLNIENVFNATYERWSDVGEVPPSTGNNGTRRHYSAPPRSLQLTVRYAF